MLNIKNYIGNATLWNGICSFIRKNVRENASEKEITKLLLTSASAQFEDKEYRTFRRAMSSLKNGKNASLQNENLYRLLFVLLKLPILKNDDYRNQSRGDVRARNLLTVYLGQPELSVRSMNEFILLSALKIGLDWKETLHLRNEFSEAIAAMPAAPEELCEGRTDEFYAEVVEHTESLRDIRKTLSSDLYRSYFAKTRNTQYLALFPDLPEKGAGSITDLYYGIFSIDTETGDCLTVEEIRALTKVFGNIFMTFDTFCKLVNRTSVTEISGETYLLSILNLPEIEIDFLDHRFFREEINDFLTYHGFANLTPEVHSFDRLFFDVYEEIFLENTHNAEKNRAASNEQFCEIFTRRLGEYLRLIAREITEDPGDTDE